MQKDLIFSAFVTTLFITGLVIRFSIFPQEAHAVILPFGGPILTVVPCDTGLWITVGPPGPGSLMIMPPPATLVYLYDVFLPKVMVLGNFDVVTFPCVVGIVPVGVGNHVLQIGTSLAPVPDF